MDKKYSEQRRFVLQKNFYIYIALLLFCIVFTQALRSTASALLFYFIVLIPFFALIYSLTALGAVKVYIMADETTTAKFTPLEYEFRIINSFFLPYPFLDAVLSVPQPNGVRCTERLFALSLAPNGAYIFKNTTTFRYRGTYEIGVNCIYVQDFFRFFRIKLDVDIYNNILVLPRRLNFERTQGTAQTDLPTDSARVIHGTDQAEVGNIRDYRMGDSLKSIHWKLSSKTQDLMVKEYNTNTGKHTYIFCDFAKRPVEKDASDEIILPEKKQKQKKKLEIKTRVQVELDENGNPVENKDIAAVGAKKISDKAEVLKARAADAQAEKEAEQIAAAVSGVERLAREKNGIKTPEPKPVLTEEDKKQKRKKARVDKDLDKFFGIKSEELPEGEDISEMEDDFAARGDVILEASETPVAMSGSELDFHRANEILPEFNEDMNEYCADGVVELAVAAVLREMREGRSCTLVWFDERMESGICAYDMETPVDFERVYKEFTTAPMCPSENNVVRLASMITESINVTLRIVTAAVDEAALSSYGTVPGMFGGAGTGCITEVLLFNPEERYANVGLRREYIELCRSRLAQSGIELSETRTVELEHMNGSPF